MPRFLIADDHQGVRQYVREALESEAGWEICGEAATGREAVAMAAATQPDFVVLDLSMPDLNGLQAAREIRARFPHIEMLILTMHDIPELMHETLAAGARTWFLKTDLHRLVAAIRRIWHEKNSRLVEESRCA